MSNRIDFALKNEGKIIFGYISKKNTHVDNKDLAFVVTGDVDERIFFNLNAIESGESLANSNFFSETINHELSHQISNTLDSKYITLSDNKNMLPNLKEAIIEYDCDIMKDIPSDKEFFIRSVYGMDESYIFPDNEKFIDISLMHAKKTYIQHKDALMPTLILSNADTHAIITRDIESSYMPDHRTIIKREIAGNTYNQYRFDLELIKALLKQIH
ncbi:hypothetical protein BG55_14355 [Erwinia mallotivora]|uniref:Uncharacterized protein n=2 Tax=Erwinia mallotivora TaxID=69222 RepID=A0A014MAD5_9GAMM|nr:hypothetical protein BG55_14355 [Erwinia mallotivora]